ncbi:MAG: bifunctional nuclease family protein [Bacteroidia bacterium]|nr:bifunctional nuclease family protein [Bacteroidia bacterium]
MQKVLLDIYGIAPGHTQGSYSLILSENDGVRKMPIIVGQYEAQAIAIELEKIHTGRPMTHDLFVTFAKHYNVTLTQVFINKMVEGVFYSLLIFDKEGVELEMDSRTSDAIALAVRFNCPIYTTESIMAEVGIDFEEDRVEKPGRPNEEAKPQKQKSFIENLESMSAQELENLLEEAISREDYLKAAQVRDEMDRRNRKH